MTREIDLAYKEYLYLQDEARKDEQEWAYNYYIGNRNAIENYLEDSLKELGFSDDDIEEMQKSYINITQKIINMLSVVYLSPAKRKVVIKNESGEYAENKKLTKYLNDKYPSNINAIDKRAHRLSKLLNTTLTFIRFNKRKKKFEFIIDPPHKQHVEFNPDDKGEIFVLMFDKIYKNIKNDDELYHVVWTKDKHFKLDTFGNPAKVGNNEGMVNPYGVIPVARLSMNEHDDFWGEVNADIIKTNEIINSILTFLVKGSIIVGTAGTLLAVNTELTRKASKETDETSDNIRRVKTGYGHPLEVNQKVGDTRTVDMKHVNFDPRINEIISAVDWHIKMIARAKGLNPNSFLEGAKATSGYSKIIDSLEQLEIRQEDIESCRDYEIERFEIFKAVNNVHAENKDGVGILTSIPDNAELVIDFAEIEIPKTQDEIWVQREKEFANGMSSPVDWLIEDNPDLTEKEAEDKIKEVLEIKRKFEGKFSLSDLINRNKKQVVDTTALKSEDNNV